MLNLDKLLFSPVNSLLNLSDNINQGLARLSIITLRDLLFYRPTSYQVKDIAPDLSNLQNGQLIQAEITIQEVLIPSNKRQPLKILTYNDTGSLLLVFFNKLPPSFFSRLRVASKHTVSGKVQFFEHFFQISHPEFISNYKSPSAIEPIYPLTYGIVNKQLHSYILKGINLLEREVRTIEAGGKHDYIKSLLNDLKLLHLAEPALKLNNECLANLAKKELIANQISLRNIRQQIQLKRGHCFAKAATIQQEILDRLGFELTSSQSQVIEEIEADQKSAIEMMRLLQGDVGSGKTLVALLTIINVVIVKFQAVLMAPTDLLANQHYQFFIKALEGTAIRVALLTGKIIGKQRKEVLSSLENGEIDILIGTHALFQEKVSFKNLGYIVIDEQHKFGVQQRLNIISKASNPDVLVMTATPIPRSLTLTMFGDMSISKLMNKPKNRLPIVTSIIPMTNLNKVIEDLNKKLLLKEKIYWVCPLIEQEDKESVTQKENLPLTDITSRFESINNTYSNIVGILHGKMKSEQKEHIMQQFKYGHIQILVATTVIEVGIDVPDATLVIIENAEQFGLAQLHQIRGRVGRSNLHSHCLLLYNPARLSSIARTRFEVMRASNDGFYLAEQDLMLRGSGEVLGTKQSGDIRFFFADLARDGSLLVEANKIAESNCELDSKIVDFQIKLFARAELNELN